MRREPEAERKQQHAVVAEQRPERMAERLRTVVLDRKVRGPCEGVADQWCRDQTAPVERSNGEDQRAKREHAADVVQGTRARMAMGAQIAEPKLVVGHLDPAVIARSAATKQSRPRLLRRCA